VAHPHGGLTTPTSSGAVASDSAAAAAVLDALLTRPSCAALVDDDAPVVVGCSGGADSMALVALAVHAARCVHAVHVDHGLRTSSATEALAVVANAAVLGAATARIVRVDVGASGNVENAAREARHDALEQARIELGAASVLLGHTLDDQAETVLLAVLRGSGLAGLSGIRPRRGPIVRPLLDIRRAETHALCAALGVDVFDDPMNHDRRIDRVWLREELLPMLSARSGRDLGVVLARQAAVIAEESDHLDRLADAALRGAGDPPPARALASLDRVVLRRAVRRFVGPPWIGGAAVDAAIDVVVGARRAVELPGGRTLRRNAGMLAVERRFESSGTVPPSADAAGE
jgi:tRNA(Ile)-lysidine synthase